MVEDKQDGSGDEDGDQTDREAEDPVVADGDIKVESGEHGTPHHHVQHLVEREQRNIKQYAHNFCHKARVRCLYSIYIEAY